MVVRTRRAAYQELGAVFVAALMLLPGGCATSGKGRRGAVGASERGLASWYGPAFHGNPSASGERFDMYRLTAAHRTLPFGTVVEVRNRQNGRSVRVRINDRGPFIRGRVIDLSYAAARELDMLGPGVVPVEIRVVSAGRPAAASTDYWVQAGAFRDAEKAQSMYRRLRADFTTVKLSTDGAWHRVRLGPYAKRRQAERTRRALQRRGIDAFLTQL